MDNYLRSNGRNHFNFSYGDAYIDASSTAFNRINTRFDTITLGYANKQFSYDLKDVVLKADSSYAGWMRLHDYNITMEDQFENTFAGQPLFGWRNDFYIGPGDDDTIKFTKGVIGAYNALRLGTGGGTNNRIDIPEVTVSKLQASVDDRTVVDTLTMLNINPVNLGIDPDSISTYYGIHHISQTAPIIGADKTYFLYSEYGDNYLNGDLDVTGLIKNEPPHAAMSFEDETESPAMAQNIWSKLTNATDNLFATTDASGITQAADSLTVTVAGDYMINASVSFSGTNTDVYEFAIFVNEVLASPKMVRSTSSTDIGSVSLPFYIDGLSIGDDISLRIRNTFNNNDATLVACSWITTMLHAE